MEYNDAIQKIRNSVSDPELQESVVTLDAMGLPLPSTGGFAAFYQVHCPTTGNDWAVPSFPSSQRRMETGSNQLIFTGSN